MNKLLAILSVCVVFAGCAQVNQPSSKHGILVMAHGGSDEWNAGVIEVVEPLRSEHTVEIAFGMADAYSLQEAISKLEAQGVGEIEVVRLFISGESFYERTEEILGLTEGAPVRPQSKGMTMGGDGEMEMPTGMRMEFWRVDTDASFKLSQEGMADAVEMNEVLLNRALALSAEPAKEDILILAHGPGDDEENQRWLDNINARASLLRSSVPFRRVQVATLREDWEDKRIVAEKEIREFVENASKEGGVAIVIPYRVNGFGPYADVLEGLEYKSDGRGLVPDLAVTQWIERQVKELRAE